MQESFHRLLKNCTHRLKESRMKSVMHLYWGWRWCRIRSLQWILPPQLASHSAIYWGPSVSVQTPAGAPPPPKTHKHTQVHIWHMQISVSEWPQRGGRCLQGWGLSGAGLIWWAEHSLLTPPPVWWCPVWWRDWTADRGCEWWPVYSKGLAEKRNQDQDC